MFTNLKFGKSPNILMKVKAIFVFKSMLVVKSWPSGRVIKERRGDYCV